MREACGTLQPPLSVSSKYFFHILTHAQR
uniref:Uncharacterized protein n=1 Tax=Anguilla anguilla TaxID=7936 RepID=A0A0E9XHA2_ANGAN